MSHHARKVTGLRSARAAEFLSNAEADPQGAVARWTGNDKRSNEPAAKRHPRNRG